MFMVFNFKNLSSRVSIVRKEKTQMIVKNFTYVFFMTSLLASLTASCSSNSDGGTTLGMKGSTAWNRNAPREDIDRHYRKMEVYELCIEWQDTTSKSKRKNISRALESRGKDPLMCYNKSSDDNLKTSRKLNRIETGLRNKCILSRGIWNGSSCTKL